VPKNHTIAALQSPPSNCVAQMAMTRKAAPVQAGDDPQGHLALLLGESILHVLVERRVIRVVDALEIIESVAELVEDSGSRTGRTRRGPRRGTRPRGAARILEEMRASFAAKS
jgi:hypothetical protein